MAISEKKQKTLVIIDVHAIIHRAFHALPPLVSPAGEPTGALYGLATFLIKTLRELEPDYIAACFDRPEPTFRHEEYKAYKATRQKAADELITQIKNSREFVAAFGIPCFEFAGFEADDIIATLAHQFGAGKNIKTIIVTGDRDTLQLVVDDRIVVYVPKKGISESFIYNEAAVREKFGISPIQMTDYKGIVGDQSDNIPGVKGVGEKGAAKIFQKFDTLEDFFEKVKDEDLEKLPKSEQSLYKKVLADKDMALFSKHLATVRTDAPVKISLEDLAFSGIKKEKIGPIFRRFGFDSLLARIGAPATQRPIMAGTQKSHESDESVQATDPIKNVESKDGAGKKAQVAEHQGALLVSVCDDSGRLSRLDVVENGTTNALDEAAILARAGEFSDPSVPKIGFNLKPLITFLRSHGKDLGGTLFDIKIALWITGTEVSEKKSRALLERYGVAELYVMAKKKLAETKLEKLFYDIEMPLIPILADMERVGILIDSRSLKKLAGTCGAEIAALEEKIYEDAGGPFNINSPKQLSEVLFGRLGIAAKGLRKTPGGAISTDAETLERLSALHPVLPSILKYRELFKLKSTYIDALPAHADSTGRIHTIFDQTGTVTGRVSSEHPNLQNIPAQSDEYAKKIRSAFIVEKGFTLASFDYSQIELRIMASLSRDETMIETFKNRKDIHVITASQVFNVPEDQVDGHMRRMAKTLNFGIIYGMGSDAFAKVTGKSREEAKEFIRKYFANFPRVKKFHEDTLAFGRAHGYIENRLGRRRWLPDLASGHPRYRAAAERMAINFPLQSFDADIMKTAMIAIAGALSASGKWGSDARMVLQVHDQLLFEIRDDILEPCVREIQKLMEAAGELAVPTVVDVHLGTSWGTLTRMKQGGIE